MKKTKIILVFIILLATLVRLYKLDQNPPSLYWDEASLGYNAFAIFTTGHDEHGEFLPLARFIAFGDYKPPGYIYAIVPFFALFGVNEFAIRFPSALSGILLVYITYLLGKKLFNNEWVGIIAALVLAISPWSLQLSRAAFEANLAATLSALGIYLFLEAEKKQWLFPLSILSFVGSFYTFNANRILAPLFVLLLSLIYFRSVLTAKKWIVVSLIVAVVFLYPSISYLQSRESRLRFQEVSIFTSLDIVKKSNERIERSGNTLLAKILHNRRVYFAREFILHYLDHLKGEYLFIWGDQNFRLSTRDLGELYLVELPFMLIGLFQLLTKRSKTSFLLVGWMLLAPIPASVARETPHMLRTASLLPTYQLLIASGLVTTWQAIKNRKLLFRWLLVSSIISLYVGSIGYYFHNYWIHYPRNYASVWQYGYKEMVQKVSVLEPNYDRISVTQYYGRPYIYFLLYNKVNPLEYVATRKAERDWYGFWNVYGFGKYDFTQKPSQENEKVLRVESKGSFAGSGGKREEVIEPNGTVIFEIGER